MFAGLKNQLLGVNKVAGVEVNLQSNAPVFNLVILQRVGNIISIVKKESLITDAGKLKSFIGKDTPVVLVVTGRGIVTRKLSEVVSGSEDEILAKIFPDAKASDFYLYKTQSGSNLFVSVIRRNAFEELHSLLLSQHIQVTGALLGPAVVQTVVPFIADSPEVIACSGSSIQLHQGVIREISVGESNSSNEIRIGEDVMSGASILAYAAAFTEMLSPVLETHISDSKLGFQNEEFRNKKLFKLYGYAALIVIFLIVFVNYLLYSYYTSENAGLAARSASYRKSLKELKELEEKFKEKELFMKKTGWFSPPQTSYYADDIAATIPATMKLTSLKLNPLNEKLSRRAKKEIFKADTILIKGSCGNPTALNPWMNELKEKNWVQSLSNIDYSYDSKTRSGNFEVEIRVNYEN